jgi:hypothetical protein
MRANEFLEDSFGTSPKRPTRKGSRPSRGHEPVSGYKDNKVCPQCGMKGCTCPPGKCNCKPVAGFKPKEVNEHKKGVKAIKYSTKPKKPINPSDVHAKAKAKAVAPKKVAPQKVDAHLGEKSKDPCWDNYKQIGMKKKGGKQVPNCVPEGMCGECGSPLAEHGKASLSLCKSSKPDSELGASMLASCKSQGLRARDGNKSHKLGKGPESRVKVGGHKIRGQKYGGPLPDWS